MNRIEGDPENFNSSQQTRLFEIVEQRLTFENFTNMEKCLQALPLLNIH